MDTSRELNSLILDKSRKKIIVGLGNPGQNYAGTWHNLGKELVDSLLVKLPVNDLVPKTVNGEETIFYPKLNILFLRIADYMNNSGPAVARVAKYLQVPAEQLIICYDDLDVDFGKYKLQVAKNPKAHNGVNSVISALGTNEFFHVRIGANTDNREQISGKDYVLGKAQAPLAELYSEIAADLFIGISA